MEEPVLESATVPPRIYEIISHGLPKPLKVECHLVTQSAPQTFNFWIINGEGELSLIRTVNEVVTVGLVG